MLSTFNLMKLNSLLKDFYTLTKIRITVFDEHFHELAAYPEQPIRFCRIIRRDETAYAQCRKCDEQACRTAARQHKAYTYRCHAGLTESIAPLYMGNILIGYLLFGHVFSYATHTEGWEQIKKLCAHYRVDMAELKSACEEQPLISDAYIAASSHILQAVACFLCMERMVSLRQQELPVQIDAYIAANYLNDISVSMLCEKFHIGKTRLYEIAKQNYGIGLAEYIRTLRIQKAKELLMANPSLPLAEIASSCGFKDYNYFITVFKHMEGVPPKQFCLKRQAALSSAPEQAENPRA